MNFLFKLIGFFLMFIFAKNLIRLFKSFVVVKKIYYGSQKRPTNSYSNSKQDHSVNSSQFESQSGVIEAEYRVIDSKK